MGGIRRAASRIFTLLAFAVALAAQAAMAQVTQEGPGLSQVVGLPPSVSVMREEGLAYGEELAQTLFPARANGNWPQRVRDIYDEPKLLKGVETVFLASLGDQEKREIRAFFEAPLGVRIVELEISARRAMLDKSVEEANAARVAALRERGDPRMDMIRSFIEANDMIEANVEGTLNSNFAFYRGLDDGGVYEGKKPRDELLRDVWQEEQGIRDDTEKWLYEYLSLAYSPLSDAELQTYIDFSKTPAGQALNRALFASFNKMFDDVSYALGRAAADILTSENL